MKFFRHFQKNLSLRIVNWVGLSMVFACLILSASYIKRELSYDRQHTKADRIVRLTLQFDDEPVDGRIYGNKLDALWQQIPEIDRVVKMRHINTAVLTSKGKHQVVNDFYMVNREFLQVFDIPLLQGDKNVMIAGEDFLPFFHIELIAGHGFTPAKIDYKTEEGLMFDFFKHKKQSEHVEEYIINRKALAILGFNTPEEAIGEMLRLEHGTLNYLYRGIIVGVTDDFNYTGLYEETIPLLMMQRRLFQHCIMVRFTPDRFTQARAVFENVWHEVNPGYSADYVFMNDVFGRMYRSEINAQRLVFVFSLLCFVIADLGLIVFMTFIIRRRTKEIAIRKVHGASVAQIIRLLNMDFIRYIVLAFMIAAPVAWYVMHRWLERFAYKTTLNWWIFALAGLTVLFISIISVSLQSRRAATANPVDGITKT